MQQLEEARKTLRILSLMDGLQRSGLMEVSARVLHEVAYLANVLAPVFDLAPLTSTLLKRRGGPFYPELQVTLDYLIGQGLITASRIRFFADPDEGRIELEATYELNMELVAAALATHREINADEGLVGFIDELAEAYSLMSQSVQGKVFLEDARYAASAVDHNDVIDFGQWQGAQRGNFSRNAALSFRLGESLSPTERLYMYLEHVQRRAARVG